MNFDAILRGIPVVNENINYWLVRTNGGQYYDLFDEKKKVAIGGDYIDPEKVLGFSKKKEEFFKSICPIIEDKTETERPGTTASQFYRFYHEVKKGDIVLIPSESSMKLKIGKVVDEVPSKYEFISSDGENCCHHLHSRGVEWIAERFRHEFNPSIISLFFSHHAIVNANDYCDYINGAIYDFFIKENTGHLMINVSTKNKIKAKTLFYLFFEMLELVDGYFGETYGLNDIDIRINLNSPGKVELISKNLNKIALVGLIVVLVSGGSFKVSSMEVGTEGLIKPVLEYMNEQDERKARVALIHEALEDLEVREPKEVAKILAEARAEK